MQDYLAAAAAAGVDMAMMMGAGGVTDASGAAGAFGTALLSTLSWP